MSGPLVTVSHYEDAVEISQLCSAQTFRAGVDVQAIIVYPPGDTHAALEAVERLAANLRRQIADAAERGGDK